MQWEIVGIVGDVRNGGLDQEASPTFYSHIPQAPRSRQSYIVRTAGDPTLLLGPMSSVVAEVDAQLAVSEMLPLAALVSENSARPRFLASVISGFAALALLIAAVGVYGVLAYIVRGRAREMGLRAALGAPSVRIVGHVLVSGMRPAIAGLFAGLAVSTVLSRYLETLLFQIDPLDTASFVLGGCVIAMSAVIACLIPAISAAKVDPIVSLRGD
jgi:putative ABC transport system permease protein